MNTQIQLVDPVDVIPDRWPYFRLLFYALLGCSLAVSSVARAASPPLDGSYSNQNIVQAEDAFSSSATRSDNVLTGWIWRETDRLRTARAYHTGTLPQNGMVLVAGGIGGGSLRALASTVLYDQATRTWSVTGRLNTARASHTATLLQNGMILVAGGYTSSGDVTAHAELYDPATGTWTATGKLNVARYLHTATLLQDGRVLVAGGVPRSFDVLASAELYDPASGD